MIENISDLATICIKLLSLKTPASVIASILY